MKRLTVLFNLVLAGLATAATANQDTGIPHHVTSRVGSEILTMLPTVSYAAESGPVNDIAWWMDERYQLGYALYDEGAYAADYIYPHNWGIGVSICSKTGDADGRSFKWTIRHEDTLSDQRFESSTCEPADQIRIDNLSRHTVSVDVHDYGNSTASYSSTLTPKDILVVTLRDSIASGEGRKRFFDEQCNKSSTSGYAEAARQIEERDPHTSVTYMNLACSEAELADGVMLPQTSFDPAVGCVGEVVLENRGGVQIRRCVWSRTRLSQLQELMMYLCDDRLPSCTQKPRSIDKVFLQVGTNDLGWSDYITKCALPDVPDLIGECINEKILGELSGDIFDFRDLFTLLDRMLDGEGIELVDDLMARRLSLYVSGTDTDVHQFLLCAYGTDAQRFRSQYDCDAIILSSGHSNSLFEALNTEGVYLGEYAYHIFSDTDNNPGGCGALRFIDSREAGFLHRAGSQPSSSYESHIARYLRWEFVGGIDDLFLTANGVNHGYCTGPHSWYEGITEFANAGSWTQLNHHALLHPTVEGHQAIATQFINALDRPKISKDDKYTVTLIFEAIALTAPAYDLLPTGNDGLAPTDELQFTATTYRRGAGKSVLAHHKFQRADSVDINEQSTSRTFTATEDEALSFSIKYQHGATNTVLASNPKPPQQQTCSDNPGSCREQSHMGSLYNAGYHYCVSEMLDGIADGQCYELRTVTDRIIDSFGKSYHCGFEESKDKGGFSASVSLSITENAAVVAPPRTSNRAPSV